MLIKCCQKCEGRKKSCTVCYNGEPYFECPKYKKHDFSVKAGSARVKNVKKVRV